MFENGRSFFSGIVIGWDRGEVKYCFHIWCLRDWKDVGNIAESTVSRKANSHGRQWQLREKALDAEKIYFIGQPLCVIEPITARGGVALPHSKPKTMSAFAAVQVQVAGVVAARAPAKVSAVSRARYPRDPRPTRKPCLDRFLRPFAPADHRAPRTLTLIVEQATRRGSSVVVRAAPKPGVDGVPYTASNTFIVPDGDAAIVQRFQEEMAARQALMKTLPGFTSCKLTAGSGNEFTFEQEWTTKQAYEDYMNHPQRRKSHLAAGIYQYMPKDKWSVPENFTPILPRK